MNKTSLTEEAIFRSSPSLALIKYWGKEDLRRNIPATSSLAMNLDGLYAETRAVFNDVRDSVIVAGRAMPAERYKNFFDEVRGRLKSKRFFEIESRANFPIAAGIASSSAGFSSLALACAKLIGGEVDQKTISGIARVGSASAARAVFGGFSVLRRGALSAEPLYPEDYWKDLRVLIAIVDGGPKAISSREAMEEVRKSSTCYRPWLDNSEKIFHNALKAFEKKDLDSLGACMQASYLGMFATMFTANPPVVYWQPDSVGLIRLCTDLRRAGIKVWETMDAGPQVKILCKSGELEEVAGVVRKNFPRLEFLVSKPGGSPCQIEKFGIN